MGDVIQLFSEVMLGVQHDVHEVLEHHGFHGGQREGYSTASGLMLW